MRLLIAGSKLFGAAVFKLCIDRGHDVAAACSPPFASDGQRPDRLRDAADRAGVAWIASGQLSRDTVPQGTDLIIAAHSHDFIGRPTRAATRLGAIGYHPSLLPLHRGRDAVEWTVRMRDRVAGGSIYWLSDGLDAGDLAAQEHAIVLPDDDAATLWRRELFPLGLMLFDRVLSDIGAGCLVKVPQAHAAATWEPAIGRPPLYRPELPQLGSIPGFEVIRSRRVAD
jgi:methionyl-tRNA formyltransferase